MGKVYKANYSSDEEKGADPNLDQDGEPIEDVYI